MFKRTPVALVAGMLTLMAAQQAPAAAPDLRTMVAPLRDYRSTLTATQINTPELAKIGKDFANSYRVKTTNVTYRAPNQVKVDGRVGPVSVVYLINGTRKSWKYGPIKGSKDVTNDPGQRQGLLDFGLLTADQLDYYTWKFIRTERVKGAPLHVFELRFKNFREDPSRRLIWVDPVHKVVVRRQTFRQRQDNVMKHDLRFENLKPVGGGVWSATTIRVFNGEGKLGAVSRLSNIQVNKGIPASIFRI